MNKFQEVGIKIMQTMAIIIIILGLLVMIYSIIDIFKKNIFIGIIMSLTVVMLVGFMVFAIGLLIEEYNNKNGGNPPLRRKIKN